MSRYIVACIGIGAALLAATISVACAAAPAPEFAVRNASVGQGQCLVTASIPCFEGEAPSGVDGWLVCANNAAVPAQTRALGEYPDGSVRRLLVRFPSRFGPRQRRTFRLKRGGYQLRRPVVVEANPHGFRLQAGPREIATEGRRIIIRRNRQVECALSFAGVDYPARFVGPEADVVENGPYFAWATATQFGGHWNVIWEVKADLFGRVEVTARLRRMWEEQQVPVFGISLAFREPPVARFRGKTIEQDTPGVAAWPGNDWRLSIQHGNSRTDVAIPDGPQRRLGKIAVSGSRVLLLRDPSVETGKDVVFREGEERCVSVVVEPPGGDVLEPDALTVTFPRQRLAGAIMGAQPNDWGAMQDLRRRAEEMVLAIQCREGDEFGDVGIGGGRSQPRYSPTHLTRVYQGLLMLEDYYLGGDPRLRDFALNWAENYLTLHIYRGLDQNAFGLERFFRRAPNMLPTWCQKGHMLLLRAYEETGDLRYLEAARSGMDAICRQLANGYFVLSYDLNRRYSLSANVRISFFCKDLVEFYRWTGDGRYLAAARKLLRGLAALRVGDGLWKEGYYDPYNPRARRVTGNNLAISTDISNAYKPYILQNLLHGAIAVYGACEDQDAYRIMRDTADYYVRTQDEGGWWSYNQTGAPSKMVGILGTRVPDALLTVYQFTGDRKYYDAALKALRLNVNLLRTYGTVCDGIGLPRKKWWFAQDESPLDLLQAGISIGGYSRDAVVGLVAAVNHFLEMFPGDEGLLLEEPKDWKAQYLLHEAPVAGDPARDRSPFAGRLQHPVSAEFKRVDDLEQAGDLQGAIEGLERIVARYPDSPLEVWRIAELYDRLGRTTDALETYRRFIASFPEHPRSVIADMRIAETLRLSGRPEEAFSRYRRIAHRYPGSPWARDARVKLWLYAHEGRRPDHVVQAVRVSGPEWLDTKAPGAIKGLVDDDSEQPYHLPTEVAVGYDDENLYLRALCHKLDPLFLALPEKRPYYYIDPEILIYLDPLCEGWSFRMLKVSVAGHKELHKPGWGRPGPLDDSDGWESRVQVLQDGWEAFISVPFEKLGANPRDGRRVWRMNFRRQRSRDTGVWHPGLAVPIMPQEFGHLVFMD